MSNPPAAASPSPALVSAWNHQREASIAADRVKASYSLWRTTLFAFAIVVAFLETLSGQVADATLGRVLAGGGAVLIALVPVIGSFKTSGDRLRQWITARSVSEQLKAEVFFYLLRCGGYASGNADAELAKVTRELVENLDASIVVGVESDGKPIPQAGDVNDYIEVRLDGQIRYYRGAAEKAAGAVFRNRTIQFLLAGVAALIGAAGALLDQLTIASWVAVITTIGASIAAYVAAGRYEHLVLNYVSTARRLEYLKNRWLADPQPDPCPFVAECEAAISSQNEGWMAEFMKAN
jgi:hypothetical protein